jgi:hypothetical protein
MARKPIRFFRGNIDDARCAPRKSRPERGRQDHLCAGSSLGGCDCVDSTHGTHECNGEIIAAARAVYDAQHEHLPIGQLSLPNDLALANLVNDIAAVRLLG